MFNNIYTKIKKLFNTKVVVEPKTKKEIEFKSKIPEYTMWVLPTTLEEEDISNQYQWGSLDMVNIHLTKEDIEELSYIWSTESKEIIDTINSRTNGHIYISQEDLRLLLNKLYDNTQDLSVFTANHLDSDYH